eukprot:992706-Pyramimonas_sp.AAC.1
MDGDEFDVEFFKVKKTYCSPLTRAIETALVSLDSHPSLDKEGLFLLRNLREAKNLGGQDTVGKVGRSILSNPSLLEGFAPMYHPHVTCDKCDKTLLSPNSVLDCLLLRYSTCIRTFIHMHDRIFSWETVETSRTVGDQLHMAYTIPPPSADSQYLGSQIEPHVYEELQKAGKKMDDAHIIDLAEKRKASVTS